MNPLSPYTTLTLAYLDPSGSPQACAVFFAPSDTNSLVFATSPSTLHGHSLSLDGRVAFTAHADRQSWATLTGVQGRGTCTLLTGTPRSAALSVYLARFPFIAADDHLATALANSSLWALHPTWLRVIDNSQGFGHKQEWIFDRP